MHQVGAFNGVKTASVWLCLRLSGWLVWRACEVSVSSVAGGVLCGWVVRDVLLGISFCGVTKTTCVMRGTLRETDGEANYLINNSHLIYN